MNLVEVNDINRDAWAELARRSSVATWFQTEEAYRFFDSLSFLEAFAFGVENEGKLKAVVVGYVQKDGGRLKQFFSRRAIITGGPLLADDISDDELRCLLNTLKDRLKQKVIYIETRNFNDYSHWRGVFGECGFGYESHYDIHVDTSSMDVVNERMGKSRKRDIRVSMRDGASVVVEPTIEQVRSCYSILRELYLTKVKTPLFPIEFFEKLYLMDSSAFLLVEYEGKIIGGTVCVGIGGKILFEMYACGKDGVYKNIFPSELATYAGLQYAAEQGCLRFDMMGAGKPDDGGYGVRDFKLKFGGKLVEYGRYHYVCNHLLYGIGKLGVKILKKA
mgnify:FL=1